MKYVPLISLSVFLGGCLLAIIYRIVVEARYEDVGKFVHEEAEARNRPRPIDRGGR